MLALRVQPVFNRPNYLKLIVDGKRNLTSANIFQIGQAMALSFDDHRYFESLVLYCQSKSEKESNFHRLKLTEMRKVRAKSTSRMPFSRILSEWYSLPLLVALDGKSDRFKHEKISMMIGISVVDVKLGITQLLKEGLPENAEGIYRLTHRHSVFHDPKLSNLRQKTFLEAQLMQSVEAFRTKYESGAKFSANTFTISPKRFNYFFSRIQAFCDSLVEEGDKDSPDEIVQLNFQFFRLGVD